MAESSIAANFDEPSDVLLNLLPKVTFDLVLVVDDLAEFSHVLVGELSDLDGGVDSRPLADLGGVAAADPVEVRERVKDGFVSRKVYA